jgi:hypothetical protein
MHSSGNDKKLAAQLEGNARTTASHSFPKQSRALRRRVWLWNVIVFMYYPAAIALLMIFLSQENLPWWVMLLVVPFLLAGKPFLCTYRDQRQLELNLVQAWSDPRPFFLILRSFSRPELQEQVQPAGRTADVFSFLEYMENALFPLGGLVYIGGELSYGKFYGGKAPRAVVLRCEEQKWRSFFKTLSAGCRAIILIPQTSEGVKEEATYLRDLGLYAKTIIAMPPQNRFRNSKDVWDRIAQDLEAAGLSLPAYNPSGAVFIPNSNLSPARIVEFGLPFFEKFMVQHAVEKLLEEIPTAGTPLKEIMEKVQ